MISPNKFVKEFGTESESLKVQFAQVDLAYSADGNPKVIFDGETALTQKRYPHLKNYTPTGGERVMLINGVIIGEVSQ